MLQMFSAVILGLIVGSIYFQLCSDCDSGIQNRSAYPPPAYHNCLFCFWTQPYFSRIKIFEKLSFCQECRNVSFFRSSLFLVSETNDDIKVGSDGSVW